MPEGHFSSSKASVVKIDGARIRKIRESLGLTQLYVATAVGVTTDTISRWENGRYPTIKRDNAQRLAVALEVSLAEILEKESRNESQAPLPPEPVKQKLRFPARPWIPIMACLLAAGLLAALYIFYSGVPVDFSARRVLPPHAAPGQAFPVLVKVTADSPKPLSFILREILPRGCYPLRAAPSYTAWDRGNRSLEWIYHSQGSGITFFYLGTVDPGIRINTVLSFNGTVVTRKGKGKSRPVTGCEKLEIKPLHWADTNGDGRIDDEEILTVYEEFGEIRGADFGLDQIEAIWAANGYKWDKKTEKFIIIP